MNDALEANLAKWEAAGPTGDAEHQARLQTLVKTLKSELARTGSLEVLFVCTHNSRRSTWRSCLRWLRVTASGSRCGRIRGGTEATAFNPRAVAALERVGFRIEGDASQDPHYRVTYSPTEPSVEAFSKTIADVANPSHDFVAVMTCSQADAACPFVKGASGRVAVPYVDPKVSDGTPEETKTYDERVEQIGRDLSWVMHEVAKR
jgi:arsenate reductase